MVWRVLADALVVIHFAFTLFVIFGGFLAWRWQRVVYAHLPALAWGCWIEISGWICPLTPLENLLRYRAGESGYTGSFLEHYVIRILYPPGLTRDTQWVLAGILVILNVVAYGRLLMRRGDRAQLGNR